MSISTTTVKQSYTCNGSTTGFDFSFPVADSSHVKAKLRHVTTGAETELTATTQFEVSSDSGTYESGGTVTTVTYASGSRALYAWSANYTLILYRETPVVQGSTYADNRAFKQSTFMSDLDKLTMIVQEMDDAQDRCLKAPVTDTTTLTIPNSTERAGMYLAFDSSGNPVAVSGEGLSSDIVTEFAETLLDDTTAEDARATLEVTRSTLGYSLMQAATAAAAKTLLEIEESDAVVSVLTYGAVGDNSTDDGPAFQDAHDALPTSGGAIYIPKAPTSKYAIATMVTITKPCLIYGDGWGSIVRANGAITSVFLLNDGAEGTTIRDLRLEGNKTTTGGTILRGVEINGATDCTVERCCFSGPNTTTGFNFGVDIVGQASNRTNVLYNRFERLVSSSGNGSAVLNEYSSYNKIIGNEIDGTNFVNADGTPGSAIFLSATISGGGIGSTDNLVAYNRITNHPQVGIDINSTTYYEWASQLGACTNNRIIGNEISGCNSANGGDASSAITIMSNSPRNFIIGNYLHHNGHATAGGHGISIVAAVQGDEAGEAKYNENPIYTHVEGNIVEYNKDNGIKVSGATCCVVRDNSCYENGQRTANTFDQILIEAKSETLDGGTGWITGNHCIGAKPRYQIYIGAGVNNSQCDHNFCPTAGTGGYHDDGTGTSTHP